jgi:hypothetical protein
VTAPTPELEPGAWVVVREHITAPLALLVAGGGSRVEALRITTQMAAEVQRIIGRDALITWTAVAIGSAGMGRKDWDPATPIPAGTEALLCQAWIRRA